MSTEKSYVIRLNLSDESIEQFELPRRPQEKTHRVFIDPTGHHGIVSSTLGNVYYLHSQDRKAMKPVRHLKGQFIESVAWDRQNSNEQTTQQILLGTSDGKVFEANLGVDKAERSAKVVYDLNDNVAVTGIEFQMYPSASRSEAPKYFIMVTTPTRYYQFVGSGHGFEEVFMVYNQAPPQFGELLSDLTSSQLVFFAQPYNGLARKFAWLTGSGIFHGKLVFGSQRPGIDTCATETDLLAFPANVDIEHDPPLSLVMTEFHFLLLFKSRFIAMSQLNGEVVFEQEVGSRFAGSMKSMVRDMATGAIFASSDICVWEVIVQAEDRFVWQLCLKAGDYESAYKHAKDAKQKDEVLGAQADHFFEKGAFDLSAKTYAKTQRSFEAIALQFIHRGETNALKTYLLAKLEGYKQADAMQRTVIATWLVELYLGTLSNLQSDKDSADRYEMEVDTFRQFLDQYRDALIRDTTYNMIASHGRIDELLYYAQLIGDYNRVISFHIQNQDYQQALAQMSQQNDPEVYYKYSPTLMACAPYETVATWMKASGSQLQPRRLIPALVRYNPDKNPPGEKKNQAIRYLEFVILKLGNKDASVHNYLLSLYAQTHDERAMLAFLQNAEDPCYDLKYALRLCHEMKLQTACVHIYAAMGLFEEAVELALSVDVDLAKLNADKALDEDLRKRLWQRIARHVVEKATAAHDRKAAIAILNECDLLKIEDVLPFFPDFVLIDDFKDEICQCLEEYNKHIEELKTEMDEATHNADLIRADIRALRNRSGYVAASQKCELCNTTALSRQFYLFPCGHVMHFDCLKVEMQKHLNPVQVRRVREIASKLQGEPRVRSAVEVGSADDVDGLENETDALTAELDDYLASECLFCGDAMIRTIDESFVQSEDESWDL
eukprot:TRINITY_DN12868_c0_g1_i1.p1 TRINITY_DN12868_c0_g1~~TRINITY_DN12868_c0_g1_i1.p1  ORF type:complete len:989 (+),score=219.79 TRINITY_DN12868_c0_g1_i1:294-2969(+)